MALQNNQSMNLVLSTDAKPRLKWTPELHYRFVEAVSQLGGAEKATPKSLMRVMGIPGLTLYHLKSHLQKYRLGKSQQSSDSCIENSNNTIDNRKQEEATEIQSREESLNRETVDRSMPPTQTNQSLQIAQALQMQMEVQRKLHEQIEVQKHLQLRIEAQGKYLQSVLKKAQETLAGYSSSTLSIELAKAELSQLASMVTSGCTSSSLSELTEFGGTELNETMKKQRLQGVCSVESSLTSSESSGRNEEKQCRNSENFANPKHSVEHDPCNSNLSPQATGKRRTGDASFDDNFIDRNSNSGSKMRKHELHSMIDLNRKYQNDNDSGPRQIDLNCHGTENPSGRF